MSKDKSLTVSFSEKYGIKQEDLLPTLLNTAFRTKEDISREQMIALLVVANQYDLNPFTKEIYAYPSKNGIVPVVGVDGWLRIINDHPSFDGISFSYSENVVKPTGSKLPCPEWVDVTIHRKDRSVPTTVREYLDEVYREPFKVQSKSNKSEWYPVEGPWQSHPKRMLRHKGIIQCARIAFSFSGIYDEDEASRIMDNENAVIDMGAAEVVPMQKGQPESKPEPVVSANKTLGDEAAKLLAEKLFARLQGGPLKPAYDYIATQYCPETQKKIVSVLENKQLKMESIDQTEQVVESSIVEDSVQVADCSPVEEFEPLAQPSPTVNPDQFEQPSLAEGIGFY